MLPPWPGCGSRSDHMPYSWRSKTHHRCWLPIAWCCANTAQRRNGSDTKRARHSHFGRTSTPPSHYTRAGRGRDHHRRRTDVVAHKELIKVRCTRLRALTSLSACLRSRSAADRSLRDGRWWYDWDALPDTARGTETNKDQRGRTDGAKTWIWSRGRSWSDHHNLPLVSAVPEIIEYNIGTHRAIYFVESGCSRLSLLPSMIPVYAAQMYVHGSAAHTTRFSKSYTNGTCG